MKYTYIIFLVSLLSILGIVVLSLNKDWKFWPPKNRNTWQHTLFNILFRLYFYSLILLTILDFKFIKGRISYVLYTLGIFLLVLGFGLAIKVTSSMGWRNAFGEKKGLQTKGVFSKSRNPIYVSSWIGMLGWGLISRSNLISLLLILWAILYILAPFLEEPWLEEQYGDEYVNYKNNVPRFF